MIAYLAYINNHRFVLFSMQNHRGFLLVIVVGIAVVGFVGGGDLISHLRRTPLC